jgi:glucuronosyltransferase
MLKLILSVLLCFSLIDCAKILGFFPIPYLSHQSHHFGLMKSLANRGHNLTIFTTHLFDYNNSNVTQIHLKDSVGLNNRIVNQHRYNKNSILEKAYNELNLYIQMTSQHLKNQHIQRLIANGSRNDFDLIILECYFNHPIMALAELFDCPIIVSTAIDMLYPMMETIGAQLNPVLHPEHTIFQWRDGTMNFPQRLYSASIYYAFNVFALPSLEIVNSYLSYNYLQGITYSRKNVENRITMVFTNYLTTIRPILPNTIPLSFLHVNPPVALPESDVKKFLDEAEHGVILMSLGSYAKSCELEPKVITTLVRVFAKMKSYRFLWKYENDELLRNLSSNVMTVKWLPQADILAHSNLLAFITHGGMMSIQEAIDREIPMIIIPLTYDQPINAESMVAKGVALRLNLNEITENALTSTIGEIMKLKYRHNIRRLKRLMNDKPMNDRDRGVWNVEYVIRNKNLAANFLQSQSNKVPLYQKQQLDVILFAVIISYIIFRAMKSLLNCFGMSHRHSREASSKAKKIG